MCIRDRLGIVCTTATVAILLFSGLLPTSLPARLCVCVFAALPTTTVWTVAGLEAPLTMMLLAIAMACMHNATTTNQPATAAPWIGAGTCLALLCWTRPDGPLWTVAAAACLCSSASNAAHHSSDEQHLDSRRKRHRLAWIVVLPALALAAQLAFRLVYYDDWLPNTGRAKLHADTVAWSAGASYLLSAANVQKALLVPAILGLSLLFRRGTPRVLWLSLIHI